MYNHQHKVQLLQVCLMVCFTNHSVIIIVQCYSTWDTLHTLPLVKVADSAPIYISYILTDHDWIVLHRYTLPNSGELCTLLTHFKKS